MAYERNSNNKNKPAPKKAPKASHAQEAFGTPVTLGQTGLDLTDVRVYLTPNAGKLLAKVSVTINASLVLKGLKVIEGKDGPFVAMPSESYKDSDGSQKFTDHFFLLDGEARNKLSEIVIMQFETL